MMRFKSSDGFRLGVVVSDAVADLTAIQPSAPRDLADLLQLGPSILEEVAGQVRRATSAQMLTLSSIKPALPTERPGKFICLGLNYADHVNESAYSTQAYPTLFMRAATSLVAHEETLERPLVSPQLDYEAELAVIIGQTMRHVTADQAVVGVAGYACFNDGSVRDYQRHTVQWTMGKNFDRTGGFGPSFVTADELPQGASGLRISSRVNGETRQSDNTANMIFRVGETLSYISQGMTLQPGDVVAMGTPSGVAHAHKPPKWLLHGDVVEVEIEGIGILRNQVANEQTQSPVLAVA
jgi:2-keto-4-pentenoate hydratase/2-oxohepta-3-ene-1,7-dioic acid hydratase in catechol pathway